jgi:proline iminopeptidase
MDVTVNGAEIFYTTRGRGPACLVPTLIGTEPYEHQMPALLDAHFQMVFVDLRGSGRSTGAATDLTFASLVEDFEAVRRAVGADRVVVLGHSVLGAAAIEYGRRRPDSVSHVIGAGASPTGDMARLLARAKPFFEEDASEERKRLLAANMAALGPGATAAATLLAQTPMRFFDPRFDAAPLYAGARATPEAMAHVLGTLVRGWDVTAGATGRSAPLLLAHGRYDYAVPYLMWQGVAEALPGTTFRLFERSGHQPFAEEPELFTSVVLDWMAAHP